MFNIKKNFKNKKWKILSKIWKKNIYNIYYKNMVDNSSKNIHKKTLKNVELKKITTCLKFIKKFTKYLKSIQVWFKNNFLFLKIKNYF